MKLAYECWRGQLKMQDLFYAALKETLSEMRLLALYKLQRMVARLAPADGTDGSESNLLSDLLGMAGHDWDRRSSLRSRRSREDSAFADRQILHQNDRFLRPTRLRATTVAQRLESKRKKQKRLILRLRPSMPR